jgi:hypothetical protein
MRLWRTYLRVGLGGLAFLAVMTAALWLLRAEAAWGFFILTFYWVVLWLVVGVILLLASALRPSANRSAKPS